MKLEDICLSQSVFSENNNLTQFLLSCPQQKGTGRTVCFPNGWQEHCDPCVVEGTKLLSLLVLCKRALILLADSHGRQRCTFFFSPLAAALLQVIHRLILID